VIFSLEALQAFNGDSLLLHAGTKDAPVLVVVDGGPKDTWANSLKPRLDELRAERAPDGTLAIDLAMISHIDDDHIAGMLLLADDLVAQQDEQGPPSYAVETLWHNSFDDVLDDPEKVRAAALEVLSHPLDDARADELRRAGRAVVASVEEGRDLRERAEQLHWGINEPFDGPVVLPKSGVRTITIGALKLTVICPHQTQLDRLQKEWDEWLAAHKDLVAGGAPAPAPASVEKLPRDQSPYNLSSIVVLAECEGKRILLTGDARDDHILGGLDEAGIAQDGKTHVDILKMPHHGSIRNMSPKFLERVTADHYVISANGSDGNPDRKTLDLIAAARPDDKFTLHLTNRHGEEDLAAHLDAFLADKKAAKRAYAVSFRGENARSLRIDLLEGG
jgi:glyoxylase-like metal-dependent hydrolase (beta-lactamase superfamily II)